jgi:hypothetical protein
MTGAKVVIHCPSRFTLLVTSYGHDGDFKCWLFDVDVEPKR